MKKKMKMHSVEWQRSRKLDEGKPRTELFIEIFQQYIRLLAAIDLPTQVPKNFPVFA